MTLARRCSQRVSEREEEEESGPAFRLPLASVGAAAAAAAAAPAQPPPPGVHLQVLELRGDVVLPPVERVAPQLRLLGDGAPPRSRVPQELELPLRGAVQPVLGVDPAEVHRPHAHAAQERGVRLRVAERVDLPPDRRRRPHAQLGGEPLVAQRVLVDHVAEVRGRLVGRDPAPAGEAQLPRRDQRADAVPHPRGLVPPPALEVHGLAPGVLPGAPLLEDRDDLVEDLAHAVLARLEALFVVLVDGEEPALLLLREEEAEG